MIDRIIQELVTSFYSWSVDMGKMGPNRDNRMTGTQSAPPTPRKNVTSAMNNGNGNNIVTTANSSGTKSLEDPVHFQRLLESRYPQHMLHCPQTSLYPIFFFFMERWEQRRLANAAATAAASQQPILPTPKDNKGE